MDDNTQEHLAALESVWFEELQGRTIVSCPNCKRRGVINLFSSRKGKVCPNGHVMHPSWDICPYCQEMQQAMAGGKGGEAPDIGIFESKCCARNASRTS